MLKLMMKFLKMKLFLMMRFLDKLNEDDIGFIDTCRCYHYGSRKSKRPRKLMILHFTSAYSLYVPIFRRKIKICGNNKALDMVHIFKDNNFYHSAKKYKSGIKIIIIS